MKKCRVDLENVAEEIIYNILVNIPARTLYDLRPVCKLWYNLMEYPEFYC
uniref:F-box domain-containing protein n=1 Tax=Nelumbo nucifera TaxID=4432 RepID=A0A822YC60_NELNU|nr:TPA_asm: hypothetical protein HUJ06_010555 [Nelumbo nucifera]